MVTTIYNSFAFVYYYNIKYYDNSVKIGQSEDLKFRIFRSFFFHRYIINHLNLNVTRIHYYVNDKKKMVKKCRFVGEWEVRPRRSREPDVCDRCRRACQKKIAVTLFDILSSYRVGVCSRNARVSLSYSYSLAVVVTGGVVPCIFYENKKQNRNNNNSIFNELCVK